MICIYPAVMGIDQLSLHRFDLLKNVLRRAHIDIMDNIFVPNETVGTDRINLFSQKYSFFPWVHLMVENPLLFYKQHSFCGNALISFHVESLVDIFLMIKSIKEKKQTASLAINPKTPLCDLFPFLNIINHVLVMSVNPGASGQSFLPASIKKIQDLVDYREKEGLTFRIGIDGGINKTNIQLLAKMGVEDFAVSSGIFSYDDPVAELNELYHLVSFD